MADHVLRHGDGDVLLAVVDAKGQADELRQDRGAAAPDLDHFVAAGTPGLLRLPEKVSVEERAFPNRTRQLFLLASSLSGPCGHAASAGCISLLPCCCGSSCP